VVVTSRAEQYRRLAVGCRLMVESLPAGQNRSALLEMTERLGTQAGLGARSKFSGCWPDKFGLIKVRSAQAHTDL
jgi:hypothetical protein